MPKVYQAIASKISAMRNCQDKTGNAEWFNRHNEAIDRLVLDYLPSGSGFDSGTQFDACAHVDSKADKLIFETAFHHTDEFGSYAGWTHHMVIVTPSLQFGFRLRITGRDRDGIKDYIAEMFNYALDMESI